MDLGDVFIKQMKCTCWNVFVKSDARVWRSGGLWGDVWSEVKSKAAAQVPKCLIVFFVEAALMKTQKIEFLI